MTDARLKQTETLEIFRIVTDAGFDSAEFRWEEKQGNESFRSSMGGSDEVVVSVLIHIPTDYYMRFGAFANEFSPGVGKRVEFENHYGIWKNRIRSSTIWLKELRKEVEAPDLWAAISQERALATAAASERLDNDEFTDAEKRHISESLEEIKAALVKMRQFDSRQVAIIDNRFKYLADSVNRLGRKDWLMISVGTFINVIVALSLTQEQGNGLLRLASTLLHQLWDGMLALGQ